MRFVRFRHPVAASALGVILVWTVAGVHWIGPDPREGAFHALDNVRLLLLQTTEQTESTAAERAATAGYAVREIRRIRGQLARARARSARARDQRVLEDATKPIFALLTSAMHMAWLRHIGARLKSDYRYSVNER